MKQKILFFFVAASVGTLFAANRVQIDDLYYNLNDENKTAEVTYEKYFDTENYSGLTTANIPLSILYNGTDYSVTRIGELVFFACTDLTSVIIPNSIKNIGDGAFSSCTGLTRIEIPNSVTSIGVASFVYCPGLTSIVVESGNSVYDSRNNCNAIIESTTNKLIAGCKNTTIPNSVTSIGEYAFYYCRSLTSITCEAVTPPTCQGTQVFEGVSKSIPLYVPAGSVEDYKAADQWKDFGENIKPIQAAESDVTEIEAEPTNNSVVIEWPAVTGAAEYIIQIWKGDALICTLSFNNQGQLQTILFEKKAGKDASKTATQTATGWQYRIGGLNPGTEYTYSVVAKNGEEELFNETKQFTTITTALDEISNDKMRKCKNAKIMRDGQLYILRDGELYNAQGARVE